MASVYKSISKKKQERLVADEVSEDEDMDMNDLMDEEFSDSDDDDDEEEIEENAANGASSQQNGKNEGFMPKTRVLMLTSRGVTHR
jgi:ribosome biogenesis protein BRX1